MLINKNVYALILAFLIVSLLSGCATNSPKIGGNVNYGDSKEVEGLTNEFGLTDLQILAESMTGSLLTSPLLASSSNKPTFTIQEVKNKTSEYIDTKAITNKIRVKLQKSNAIRFMSDAVDEAGALSEMQRQNQSGRYSQSKAKKLGKAEGASYRLFGEITSIVKRAGDVKNIDYTLTLQVEDLESSEIVWTDEKEIRKTSERSMF
jgi:uncharacterized protein (TIGR02722 family)